MYITTASEKKTQIVKTAASIALTALMLAAIALWVSFSGTGGNVVSFAGDPVPADKAAPAADVAYADEGNANAIEAAETAEDTTVKLQNHAADGTAGERMIVVSSVDELPETAKLVGTAYQNKDTGEVRVVLATD